MRGLSWLLYCIGFCLAVSALRDAGDGTVAAGTADMVKAAVVLLSIATMIDLFRAVTR
jgi:hypothetical protein